MKWPITKLGKKSLISLLEFASTPEFIYLEELEAGEL